jgi:hypothetical protein
MSRRPIRRAALLVTLALVFAPQSAARADTQEASAYRFIGNRCSWGQTWVTNDWGLPALQSVATIDASVFSECDRHDWTTQPTEGIGVRQDLHGWDARGFPFLCNQGPWIFWDGAQGQRHELWTWWAFNRPCNTNWYRGQGFAAIRTAGLWQGQKRPGVDTGWVLVR